MTTNTVSDADCIARSVADPAAFGQIFDRHAVGVRRYVARRLGPGSADDVTAEVFAVAFAKRASYDPRLGEARPWLLGIATRLIARLGRDEARRWRAYARITSTKPSDVAARDETDALADAIDASTTVRRLGHVLADLSPGDRDVLLLFAFEELSYQQIASALSIPIGTVRSRLNRSRRTLREALTRHESSEVDHG